MGFVANMFNAGNNAQKFTPSAIPLQQAVTDEQLKQNYEETQASLAQQQSFLNALNGQNGVQNQSQVYNQLQGIANGTGPNVAGAQFNQATNNNIANQAALMAGQRGAGSNVGLISRQAAMQGANIQQQAAQQAAINQAMQQQAAINAAGNIATNQVGQQASTTQALAGNRLGQEQNMYNAVGQYNNAGVSQNNAINSANTELAKSRQGEIGGMLNGVMGAVGPASKLFTGAGATGIGNIGADSLGASGLMGGAAEGGAGASDLFFGAGAGGAAAGGGLEAAGTAAAADAPALLVAAHGGEVPGPRSFVGKHIKGHMRKAAQLPAAAPMQPVSGEQMAAKGMQVPGKAKVKGDSLKNDVVPARLSPGEIVLPRSVVNSKDPAAEAAKFVQAILAKQGLKK